MNRRETLCAITAGLAAVLLWACGEQDGEPAADGCPDRHSALPIAGAAIDQDRRTVKIAYRAAAVPCQFEATLYEGTLYVALRAANGEEGSNGLDSPLACVEGQLGKPLPTGVTISPMSTQEPSNELKAEAKELFEGDCEPVERGQPSFIID